MEIYTAAADPVNGQAAEIELPAFLPRGRPHAARNKPKPISVSYIRSDDGADMIEIGPHQAASLDALLALRLAPSAIKTVEAA